MKWNKYRIRTTVQAEDMISYTLGEMGIEGVEIEDKVPLTEEERKSMFIDVLPDLGEDDGVAYVSFYIEPEKDHPETISDVKAALSRLSDFLDVGDLTIEKTQTADSDWINNWKQFWKPFQADPGIWICPSWMTLKDAGEDDLVVSLDPGTAFGTGMHHTTRLCIHQLRKYLQPGQSVLDVGTGSGILSIIARLTGAGKVTAVDIDPHAVEFAGENVDKNGIDRRNFTLMAGDLITDPQLRRQAGLHQYDIVLANIFADIIIPLAAVIKDNMKEGGIFISSGIIDTREEEVRRALLENGFEILEVTHSGDWAAFTVRA